jgi:pimeloyl-ACP methyl ester carboxylesterase
MKRAAGVFAAMALIGGLGGCMEVNIDQGSVFAPVAFDAAAAQDSGGVLRGERAFADAGAWSREWADRVERGLLTTPAPDFIMTAVEHGRLEMDGGPGVAWTKLSREGEGRPLIVRCGGNASTRQNNAFVYGVAALPHGDVLLFDYPGSGETGGEATPVAFEALGEVLPQWVREQAAGRTLVLWGHSLGGFVCADLARRLPETRAVIFEATARNPQEVAKAWTPWFAGPFVKINIDPGLAAYDNAKALDGFAGPVLVLGGTKDRTLPVQLARDLHAALEADGRDVTYVEFPDGVHSDFPGQANFPQVIADFFARVPGTQ